MSLFDKSPIYDEENANKVKEWETELLLSNPMEFNLIYGETKISRMKSKIASMSDYDMIAAYEKVIENILNVSFHIKEFLKAKDLLETIDLTEYPSHFQNSPSYNIKQEKFKEEVLKGLARKVKTHRIKIEKGIKDLPLFILEEKELRPTFLRSAKNTIKDQVLSIGDGYKLNEILNELQCIEEMDNFEIAYYVQEGIDIINKSYRYEYRCAKVK